MKKNKGIKLLLVLSILAILLLVYFLAIPKLSQSDSEADSETEDSGIVIADYTTDDLTSFSYSYPANDMSLSFSYKSSTYSWYIESDKNFPLDQDILSEMATAITSITATRNLGTDISKEDSGLDSPQLTVTGKYGEKERTFYVGNYNSFNSSYYFAEEGDSNVYLLSSDIISCFDYTLLQLADYEDIPTLSSDNVTSYNVTTMLESYDIDSSSNIAYLSSLYISGCVQYNPTEEDLSEYMLDSQATVITIPYTETKTVQNEDGSIAGGASIDKEYEFVIKVGALCDGDDTKRYVLLNDSPLVYKMSSATLEKLITPIEETESEAEAE